ncbi:response regulator transcription factor [Ferrimonas lipolytica]|nr:response regulator [Ferrimonas lipolytica]
MTTVYVVDDEADVRESLAWMLSGVGIEALLFESAVAFLEAIDAEATGVAILDINMPKMDGIELQAQLNQRGCLLSVIFLTGYATVPKAVQALQAGAMDFLEKPVNGDQLLALIQQGLELSGRRQQETLEVNQLAAKLTSLTERERELMMLVINGHTNKAIAAQLFIAQRTVEIHRKSLFDKMGVNNAAELALLLGRHQAVGANHGQTK